MSLACTEMCNLYLRDKGHIEPLFNLLRDKKRPLNASVKAMYLSVLP